MSSAKKMLLSAAGNAGDSTDVADVFSTFLFDGTGSNQTITNGIDLDGEGGLVWIKTRSVGYNNVLTDTARGVTQQLSSNQTDGQQAYSTGLTAFNDNGFTIGSNGQYNNNNTEMTSWTFRKSPKFFDIVTYTGNGSNRTIAHSLDSTVGMIMIKNLGVDDPWAVYHRGANEATNAENYYFSLNTTAAKVASANWWNNTAPTSSVFTVSTDHSVNANGENYVAYLFAHNDGDGEFGSGGDSDIIKCGTFQGQGTFNIGFEPQWVMIKRDASATYGDWMISDKMRGWNVESAMKERFLAANVNTREAQDSGDGVYSNSDSWEPTATGFRAYGSPIQSAGNHYIYMAIRAPMITEPSAATEVFALDTSASSAAQAASPPVQYYAGFPVDMTLAGFGAKYTHARLTNGRLRTDSTAVETVVNDHFDSNQGYRPISLSANTSYLNYLFKRAKGFFDVVGYTGNDSYDQVPHSLGVAPEMVWYKERAADTGNYGWGVVHTFATSDNFGNFIADSFGSSYSNVSNFTTTHFPEILDFAAGGTYIAYLFASLAGISKIGLIAHSGSSTDVNCGFSNGSRFVMLKRMDAAGAWYVWDSVRGIVSGDDPYHLLNTNAALVTDTDFIDPLASGFQISGDFTDGTYLFYAIA